MILVTHGARIHFGMRGKCELGILAKRLSGEEQGKPGWINRGGKALFVLFVHFWIACSSQFWSLSKNSSLLFCDPKCVCSSLLTSSF
jgi:hypothetical protein